MLWSRHSILDGLFINLMMKLYYLFAERSKINEKEPGDKECQFESRHQIPAGYFLMNLLKKLFFWIKKRPETFLSPFWRRGSCLPWWWSRLRLDRWPGTTSRWWSRGRKTRQTRSDRHDPGPLSWSTSWPVNVRFSSPLSTFDFV